MKSKDEYRELMTAIVIAAMATAASASLMACNTTEGVGEDIGAAGDAIDDAAEDSN